MGVDLATVPLLHAAVLDARLKKVILEGGLASYDMIETSKIQHGIVESVIPGVLKDYDLPDLVAALAPRPTWIVDARDPLGYRAGIVRCGRQCQAPAADAFNALAAKDALHIEVTEPKEEFDITYRGLK